LLYVKSVYQKNLKQREIYLTLTLLSETLQDQDSHGGGFDIKQSFVGMMSDVHMWDYVLSPCDIQNYADYLNFPAGNVLDWKALSFQITGRVLIEEKQNMCW